VSVEHLVDVDHTRHRTSVHARGPALQARLQL
jgi:hypothetical protein